MVGKIVWINVNCSHRRKTILNWAHYVSYFYFQIVKTTESIFKSYYIYDGNLALP